MTSHMVHMLCDDITPWFTCSVMTPHYGHMLCDDITHGHMLCDDITMVTCSVMTSHMVHMLCDDITHVHMLWWHHTWSHALWWHHTIATCSVMTSKSSSTHGHVMKLDFFVPNWVTCIVEGREIGTYYYYWYGCNFSSCKQCHRLVQNLHTGWKRSWATKEGSWDQGTYLNTIHSWRPLKKYLQDTKHENKQQFVVYFFSVRED